MPPESSGRSLHEYLRVLRKHRVMIIAAVVLAGISALVFSAFKSPTYISTATVSFSDQSKDLVTAGIPATQNPNPDKFAAASANAVRRPAVAARVKRALGVDESVTELRSAVSTTVDPASNLVDISVRSSSADASARVANEFARQTQFVLARHQRAQYAEAARRLKSKLEALPVGSAIRQAYLEGVGRLVTLSTVARPVEIQQRAEPPSAPASPKPKLYTFIGALLGLIIGVATAFVRESLDRRVTDPSEIERQLGFSLLGYVPATTLGRFAVGTNGNGPTAQDFEAFRILRFNSRFLEPEEEQKVLMITSPLAEEGKSTVATGLAAAHAMAGKRTLLIEADLRRPVLAARLGVSQEPGLTDYLHGQAEAEEIFQLVDVVNGLGWPQIRPSTLGKAGNGSSPDPEAHLVCITAGSPTSSPAELLGADGFQELVKTVRETYDVVVIDTAPVLPVGDTLELLTGVDGILVCIRMSQTTRDQALALGAALERLPGRPTGLVVTGVKPREDEGYYGYEYQAAAIAE
jgi:polysaccharide biosynthesis transport protein